MYKLIRFKVLQHCPLSELEISQIKDHINYNVEVINKNLSEGKDRFDLFNEYLRNELNGMKLICGSVGISVQVKFVEGDQTK